MHARRITLARAPAIGVLEASSIAEGRRSKTIERAGLLLAVCVALNLWSVKYLLAAAACTLFVMRSASWPA